MRGIPENIDLHNNLVAIIEEVGFKVPNPNSATGFRVGHVDVKEPKPNHPTSYGNTQASARSLYGDYALPIAYIGYGEVILVNIDKQELTEYHTQLGQVLERFFSTLNV